MTDATKKLIEELENPANDFPSYLKSLAKVAAFEIRKLVNEPVKPDPFAPVSPESARKADWH